jgi:hypothetical protein
MNPMTLRLIRSAKNCLIPSLYALALACGAANEPALGESEQPFSAADADGEDTTAACDSGTPAQGPFGAECQVIARGRCFATADEACACAGCGVDQCAIAESFPAQAFCQSGDGSSGVDPDAPVSDGPIGGGTNGATVPGSEPGCGEPGQTDPSAPDVPACAGGRPQDARIDERCDFVVGGTCFDDAAAACACGGCSAEACLVLESYPAQIVCP